MNSNTKEPAPALHPQVTQLFAVWLDEELYFCTDPGERKVKKRLDNSH